MSIQLLKKSIQSLERHYPYEDESGVIKISLGRYMNGMQYLREALAAFNDTPPEARTEEEKNAFAFGWFKGLEAQSKLSSRVNDVRVHKEHDEQRGAAKSRIVGYQNTDKPDDIVAMEEWDNIDPMWHFMYKPVYAETPPTPWYGLDDNDVLEALMSVDKDTKRVPFMLMRFAVALQEKLKEKNHDTSKENLHRVSPRS